MVSRLFPVAAVALALASAAPAHAREAAGSVAARFGDPATPMLVVAHRACHNPAPRHGLPGALSENSLAGIERCIALGVDVAEVDVRRTRDGYLVLMHDDSVDRTTDGHGKVADLSLAQIRSLHLRDNEGGADMPLTDRGVPTLEEALATAKGRILLNLDVQAGLYADTVAVVRGASQQDGVIVKQPAGTGSPVLADVAPFDAVAFMPILVGDADMPAVAERQLGGRRHPVAFELPRMTPDALPVLAAIARRGRTRLWVNTLWEGFVAGVGGDVDALRDPDAVWGRLRRSGVSVIQTDEPEALLRYLGR
ncbi:glycerophosphodiester phosphodiesterase family protein [Sphingomonas sp. 2R-10]|uniref:glycerophosphodiester phosphodiesterase family protein n=1 Tax=Sphingomonas sp. 2R-10 TaxID=3045148 RepID=UPI000F7B31F5|nr:glycerophosphodiester phosphodiesterase family protein [Sphingomonas sp. 2R-10]MDJ0277151.1 glycerophosphodiester phosphodiesterase family protein [Sphingomonas sp. 2R-10]